MLCHYVVAVSVSFHSVVPLILDLIGLLLSVVAVVILVVDELLPVGVSLVCRFVVVL